MIDWNKPFAVLSISRQYLHHTLGFSQEAVESLTDEEMQAITETVRDNLLFVAGINFDEEVRFVVACEIIDKRATGEPS